MANIRNSITMQDRMTPVFRSIIKSMDSTLRAMERLDKQANKGNTSKAFRTAQKDIQNASNSLIKMNNHLDKSNQASSRLSSNMSRVSSSMSGIGSKGFNLVNLSAALYLLKSILSTLSDVMETPDTMNALTYRLGAYDTTGATGEQLFNSVYKAAMDSRSDLASTGQLASRILITGATDGNGQQAIDLANTMNKASFLGGSSAGESQRALLQLSQGLASGFLQGDELRAIREQAPGLMDVLAKGLDKMAQAGQLPDKFKDVSIGQLKELGSQGELTADRIVRAFQGMKEEVDKSFKDSPRLFSQSMAQVKTVWGYFLKLLSQGDGAMAKINKAAWELADWLTTEDGWDTLSDLATILGMIADVGIGAFKLLGEAVLWLRDNSDVAKAALFALGAVAVMSAGSAIAAWVAACWPVILFAAVVGLSVYLLLQAGYTVGQVMGAVVGSLYFLAVGFYDAVIIIVEAVWAVIALLWDIVVAIAEAIGTVFQALAGIIEGVVVVIVTLIAGMATKVLKIISAIASGIDAVFGSNLAASVNGWIDTLGAKTQELTDKMGANIKANFDVKSQYENAPWADFNAVADWRMSNGLEILNPLDAYSYGSGVGQAAGDSLGQYNLYDQISQLTDSVTGAASGGIPTNGGNLDSVGKIGSDVSISDEDLKLLRDIAAKEFLIQMASLTPQVNVSFGDVRETADVHAIMGVIETMAEEALATSLVGA